MGRGLRGWLGSRRAAPAPPPAAPPPDAEPPDAFTAKVLRGTLEHAVDDDFRYDLEARFLHDWLDAGDTFLDVGANRGSYAVVAQDVVGPEGLVVVEPLPALADELRGRFPEARVVGAALSDHTGEATVRVPRIAGRSYATRATLNDHSEPGQDGADEVAVRLSTLDTVAAELGLTDVDVLKIDVEGHELELLAGGESTITGLRPLVLIEIEARHHEHPVDEVFSWFETRGLAGYTFDPRSMDLLPLADFDVARDQDLERLVERDFVRYLNNFWFVPPEREERFVAAAGSFLDALTPLGPASS